MMLRPATHDDSRVLLLWRNDETAIAMSKTRRGVTFLEHDAWLTRTLADPSIKLFIGEDEMGPIGMVRLNLEAGVGLVSLAVSPRARGNGFGGQLLEAAVEEAKRSGCVKVVAEVRWCNAVSRHLFTSRGFDSPTEFIYYEKVL